MNSDWEKAIEFVLKAEGGFSGELIPNDKGGYTKFGISSVHNPEVNVPKLTMEDAKEIYKTKYWNVCKCDELPSPLAIVVFDAAVNQGTGAAARMLQIALGTAVDGVVGDKTIAAAHKSVNSVRNVLSQRMARYVRTVLKDPTQEVFIENWSNRLMSLAEAVL